MKADLEEIQRAVPVSYESQEVVGSLVVVIAGWLPGMMSILAPAPGGRGAHPRRWPEPL